MLRRTHRVAVTVATLAASTALAGPAAAVVPQLGPRPDAGGAGGVTGTASPEILRVDETQTFTATTTWSTFYSPNSEFGPWIVRTTTPSYGPGVQLQGPPCATMIFAETTSCTLKAVSGQGGWRTHGVTITLNNGSSATYKVPYAILPPGVYNIGGKFIKRGRTTTGATREEPAAGVPVIVEEIGGDGEKYSTTTGAQGQYDVQVEQGQWRVRSPDSTFCHDNGSQSCSLEPTVSTGGDQTVNFVQPGPITASGQVKTDDGVGVKDAKVRARQTNRRGELVTKEAVSDKDGKYTITGLEAGSEITFDSPVPYICPITPGVDTRIGDDSACEVPKRLVTSQTDLTQDFEKPGCIAKIDFGSSMVARGRCFKLDGPEAWETDEPFRLNGIDFHPSGKVTFDKLRRIVDWTGAGLVGVSLDVNGRSEGLPPMPDGFAGVWSFETALTKFALHAPLPLGPEFNFAGYPLSGQATVEMTSGASTLSLKLTVPTDPAAQYQFLKNAFKDTASLAITAKVATDNDFGVRGVTGQLDNPGNIGGINTHAKFKNPLAVLKSVKVGYDWKADLWTFGGSIEPAFLKKGAIPGPSLDEDARGGTIEGSITANGIPPWGTFQTLSGSASGLNRPIGPVFLQRLKAAIPLSLWSSNSGGSFNVGFGVSAGPAQKAATAITLPFVGSVVKVPAEKASIDADATVSWTNLTSDDVNDLQIGGTAALKFWDQEVGKGSFGWYPYQGYTTVNVGNIGLTDPTGGSFFAVRGEAGFTLDLRKGGTFTMGGRGNITFGGQGFVGDWLVVGPSPTVWATCAELLGVRMGGAINFDEFNWTSGGLQAGHDATCDLAPWRALKPTAPVATKPVTPPPFSVDADKSARATRSARSTLRRAAKPASSQRFSLRGDEGTIPFEVNATGPGLGLPDLTLTGPGLKVTLPGTKALRTKSLATFVFPAQRRMRVLAKGLRKGTYRVSVAAKGKGGPQLQALLFSRVLPDAEVQTSLDASTCAPTVRWSATNLTGQSLRFVERSPSGDTIVGTSEAKAGKLTIAALPEGGRAELVVQVVNGQTVRKEQTVGSYTSTVPGTVPGPSGVTVKAAKSAGKVKRSTISWKSVCGAEAYAVVTSDGRTDAKAVLTTGTTVTLPRPKGKDATVTVTTLGRGSTAAGSTLTPFE